MSNQCKKTHTVGLDLIEISVACSLPNGLPARKTHPGEIKGARLVGGRNGRSVGFVEVRDHFRATSQYREFYFSIGMLFELCFYSLGA
jgi:hypothetical protein